MVPLSGEEELKRGVANPQPVAAGDKTKDSSNNNRYISELRRGRIV